MEVFNNFMNFIVKNYIVFCYYKEFVGGFKNLVIGLMDCKYYSLLLGDSYV